MYIYIYNNKYFDVDVYYTVLLFINIYIIIINIVMLMYTILNYYLLYIYI